jgi:hypothetical protein
MWHKGEWSLYFRSRDKLIAAYCDGTGTPREDADYGSARAWLISALEETAEEVTVDIQLMEGGGILVDAFSSGDFWSGDADTVLDAVKGNAHGTFDLLDDNDCWTRTRITRSGFLVQHAGKVSITFPGDDPTV